MTDASSGTEECPGHETGYIGMIRATWNGRVLAQSNDTVWRAAILQGGGHEYDDAGSSRSASLYDTKLSSQRSPSAPRHSRMKLRRYASCPPVRNQR